MALSVNREAENIKYMKQFKACFAASDSGEQKKLGTMEKDLDSNSLQNSSVRKAKFVKQKDMRESKERNEEEQVTGRDQEPKPFHMTKETLPRILNKTAMQSKSIVIKVVPAKIKRRMPNPIYVNKDSIFKDIEKSMKKTSAEMNYKSPKNLLF